MTQIGHRWRLEMIAGGWPTFRIWQILLQKSLMASANSDSVASTMQFAAEAGDDGAAQSRPRAAILFILS